jgi:hypothetical protein
LLDAGWTGCLDTSRKRPECSGSGPPGIPLELTLTTVKSRSWPSALQHACRSSRPSWSGPRSSRATRRCGQTAPDSEPWRYWALHSSDAHRIRIHHGRVLRMDCRNGPRLDDAWLRNAAMRRNQGVQGRHWLRCGLRRVVLKRLRDVSTRMRRTVAGRHRTLTDPWAGSDITVGILARRSPTESD